MISDLVAVLVDETLLGEEVGRVHVHRRRAAEAGLLPRHGHPRGELGTAHPRTQPPVPATCVDIV